MEKNLLNVKGRIFDIQRFSIHDGFGIRTIVFFKGCALRCKWCCNPESQEFETEKMRLQSGEEKIIGTDVSVSEVLETVLRDKAYYRRSNGGITLSGGECLCQGEFAKALLFEAKNHGLNTAIESTACMKWEQLVEVLPYIDTFLMDIKHMNSPKHRLFTGKENSLVLENAKKIAESALTNLIIRVPVIPSFNCTENELLDIAKFAQKLQGVKEIHLLPYHKFGTDKYKGLNRVYKLKDIEVPTSDEMKFFKETIENHTTLKCQIGG